MTPNLPSDLADTTIERMLVARAGSIAPAALTPSIMSAISDVPQRRRRRLPPLGTLGAARPRTLAFAAVLVLATVVATVVVVGALRGDRDAPQVVPPSLPAIPTASPVTPVESSPPPVTQQLIVLALGTGSRVEIYTLDPFSGDRVDIGILQPQPPVGQMIQWAADRQTAISFSGSDSVHALVDVARGSLSQLRLQSSGGRDAVSPAGDLVGRLDTGETGGSDLVVVDLDGNETFRATLPDGIQPLINVEWAPDASQIVVSTCLPCPETDPPHQQHLLLVPLDGGPTRDLNVGLFDYLGSATWSPDMTAIAVADNDGIMTVAVPGAEVTRITDQVDAGPAWSPDGSRIAFTRSGADGGVYVMAADGSEVRQLAAVPGEFTTFDVHWSPDGDWILYSRDRSESSLGDLWIVSSAGGEPRLLVENAVADW